jgi:hypothetical protein
VTALLTICCCLSAFFIAATVALLTLPAMRPELALWHFLRVQALRRWITKKRGMHEPLDNNRTVQTARKNLLWHLTLTFVFFTQLGIAAGSAGSWWRPLAPVLVIPCIVYFAGSIVQRQKIAIVRLRERSLHSVTRAKPRSTSLR